MINQSRPCVWSLTHETIINRESTSFQSENFISEWDAMNSEHLFLSFILFLTFLFLEYRWDYVSRCADCFSFHLSSKRKIQGHEIISPGEGWIIHKTPRPPVDLSFIKRLALKTGRIEENETLSLKYIYILLSFLI